MNTIPAMPIPTQSIVRLASSFGESGGEPVWFWSMM